MEVDVTGVREVVKGGDLCYFVNILDEVEDWPEEHVLAEAARAADKEIRLEQVAGRQRFHWAKETLLQRIWASIQRRKELRRWAPKILLDNFRTYVSIKEMCIDFIDASVEESEKSRRKEVASKRSRKAKSNGGC